LEKRKKSRRRRLVIWLAIDVAVAAVVIALLLYRPARYNPVLPADVSVDPNDQIVHPYLHRDLASTFYNETQKHRPFEMVVVDQSLNEAIVRKQWQSESVALSSPQILFVPGGIVLMGTADLEGAKFIVTVELNPMLDERGYLSLGVEKVKVGAMNVTPLAKLAAKRMYQEQIQTGGIDLENIGTKIVASLLNEEAFDPLVQVDGKSVRLESFELQQGKLVARFVPAR
jgi:hypothetical protein